MHGHRQSAAGRQTTSDVSLDEIAPACLHVGLPGPAVSPSRTGPDSPARRATFAQASCEE